MNRMGFRSHESSSGRAGTFDPQTSSSILSILFILSKFGVLTAWLRLGILRATPREGTRPTKVGGISRSCRPGPLTGLILKPTLNHPPLGTKTRMR